jgi:hypothetical protein
MARLSALAAALPVLGAVVRAQPNPQVQKNITAAIKAAATANEINPVDYTKFVNPFVGTGARPSMSFVNVPNSTAQITMATSGPHPFTLPVIYMLTSRP